MAFFFFFLFFLSFPSFSPGLCVISAVVRGNMASFEIEQDGEEAVSIVVWIPGKGGRRKVGQAMQASSLIGWPPRGRG